MKRFAFFLSFFVAVSALAEPVPLFDGKTLDGWESREPSLWKIEEGCLTGGGVDKIPHNDFLCTKKSFSNFVLKLKIKLTGDPKTGMINSGIQIRTQRNPTGHEVCGYQCDYGEPSWYGGIYDEGRRNRFIAPADMAVLHPAIKLWDWNEYVIRAEGNRIQTWINGVPGVDYKEEDPNIPIDGIIGIQVHAGGNTKAQVKEVTIEELPATKGAPTWESLGGVEGVRAKLQPPKKAAANDAKPASKRDISYNAVATTAKTPEEERATFKLPEGFEAELIAAESEGIGKFVPLVFDQHGALWTTTAFEYPVDGNENPAAAEALYASHAKDKVLVYDRDPKSPTGFVAKPRVFADGLAIPLGVLPYKDGCYVLHGHDIVLMHDTDGDGKADKSEVILTGFGVQDAHLFPHQFTRAPGGWIWMAQGAFNYGKVSRPGDEQHAVQFDQTRMAKFRPDGSEFTITSNGPCNIWGLVLNGEGEAFIQEANDFGYPVMPFHEYANYPGCSDRQWKSYAPEFPGTAPDFKMGGTGLSGLALTDKAGPFTEPWRDMMLVANPITNRIQGIKMHRDGPRWKLDAPTDFLVSSDPWFRPVAITIGPDGCLYIVDWYNKIISHNEVPRNHPDRDKTRGRIWRVKAKAAKPFDVPDFTKLSGDELIAKLGGDSLAQSHLAWQAIGDRGITSMYFSNQGNSETQAKLWKMLKMKDPSASSARVLGALWAIEEARIYEDDYLGWESYFLPLLSSEDHHLQREGARALAKRLARLSGHGEFADDFLDLGKKPGTEPDVRAEIIRGFGNSLKNYQNAETLQALLSLAGPALAEPTAPSTKNGKSIKVREAYDREFERYLVRMFLEQHPDAVAKFLDSDTAKDLPVEARLLASLALEPKASAARVAKLLPQLQRAPGQEEVLRLAQFPDEPGVGEAIKATLANPATSKAFLEALVAVRSRIDAVKLTPLLTETSRTLLASTEPAKLDLGIRLASAFNLGETEAALATVVEKGTNEIHDWIKGETSHCTYFALSPAAIQALKALREMRSDKVDLFDRLARFGQQNEVRDDALAALASSRSPNAGEYVINLWKHLDAGARRSTLDRLISSKAGARAAVAAIKAGTIAKNEIDGATVDKLQAVLGDNPDLAALMQELGALFRPVLALDGSDNAWTQTNVTLDGPCTIEAWVRLDPQGRKIGNNDSIAGAPGQLDFNFFGERARIYAFPPLGDVAVAKKPITPGLWTHVAATRDAAGIWKLYIDGELDSTGNKPAPGKIENIRLAWNGAKGGTQGVLSEVRLWNRERSANEIRSMSDRSLSSSRGTDPKRVIRPDEVDALHLNSGLVFASVSDGWGKLQAGAKVIKTCDFPPILTADEAATLDAKYTKNRALAEKPGDPARGKIVAAVCQACHLMGPSGGNIGPNLSGVGAMGTEAILRNVLQPNAAMENGYRIYRVELTNGDIVDALYVSEDKDAVVIRLPGVDDRRIARKDIRSTKYLRRSLMPEGLLDTFTPEQVSDLFVFLKTLK